MKFNLTNLAGADALNTSTPYYIGYLVDRNGNLIETIKNTNDGEDLALLIVGDLSIINEVKSIGKIGEYIPKILLRSKNSSLLGDTDVIAAQALTGTSSVLLSSFESKTVNSTVIKDINFEVGRVLLEESFTINKKQNNEIIAIFVNLTEQNEESISFYIFAFGDGEYKTIQDEIKKSVQSINNFIELLIA